MQSPEDNARLDQVRAINQYATNLMKQGQLQNAVREFDRALAVVPNSPITHFNRANALMRMGDGVAAGASYLEALRLEPDYVKPMVNLGALRLMQEEYADAALWLRKAVELEPSLTLARLHLARALASQQKYDEALQHYEQVLKEMPGHVDCRLDMVTALAETGDFERALAECRHALNQDPRQIRAYSWIARLDKEQLTPAEIDNMIQLADAKDMQVADRRKAHFSLGRLFDERQQYDRAFDHFAAGNALKGAQHDPERHEQLCNTIISTFTADFFAQRREFGNPSRRPVFVIGMPRSGTTLNEQILTCHPQVTGVGELEEVRSISQNSTEVTGIEYPQSLLNLPLETIANYADRYLRRIDALVPAEAERVVDKWPTNFLHLGLIALMFPGATILHCRRHPLDTCVSCYFQGFAQVHYSFNLTHLGRFYRQYERLMEHWRAVLPLEIRDVSYEELVADQEKVTRETLEHCGLPWDETCMQFHLNAKAVRTSSLHQVRRPLYSSSVERWKNYEHRLDELKAALGRE